MRPTLKSEEKLELTKLCADAMGLHVAHANQPETGELFWVITSFGYPKYDPLDNDAQAMALVKKLHLEINYGQGVEWEVNNRHSAEGEEYTSAMHPDLNRAIVVCVARMQAKA